MAINVIERVAVLMELRLLEDSETALQLAQASVLRTRLALIVVDNQQGSQECGSLLYRSIRGTIEIPIR